MPAAYANILQPCPACHEVVDSWVVKIELRKSFTFEAAHQLPQVPPEHKCSRMHGHSFRVEVHIGGQTDPKMGWLVDHASISEAMEPVLKQLDHRLLNDIPGLENPTFENLARWIWERLRPVFPGLRRVIIHETANASCVYEGE